MFGFFVACSGGIRIVIPNSNLFIFQLFILFVSIFVGGYIYLEKNIENILGYSEFPNFGVNWLNLVKLKFGCKDRKDLRIQKPDYLHII